MSNITTFFSNNPDAPAQIVIAEPIPKDEPIINIDLNGVGVMCKGGQWFQYVTGGKIAINGPGDLREDPVLHA